MKRMQLVFLLCLVAATILCIYKIHQYKNSETMAVPQYPLQLNIVSKACEDIELSCVIEEHDRTETIRSFSLRDEDDKLLASMKSQHTENQRMLGITFYTAASEEDITEECEKIILLGTRLSGGFKDEYQVYNQYVREFNSDKASGWQADIENTSCEIAYEKMPERREYVVKIGFIAEQ